MLDTYDSHFNQDEPGLSDEAARLPHDINDDWTREEIAFEITRLQRVVREGTAEESTIAQMQLEDYLEYLKGE
jgi:hypothetical protein